VYRQPVSKKVSRLAGSSTSESGEKEVVPGTGREKDGFKDGGEGEAK